MVLVFRQCFLGRRGVICSLEVVFAFQSGDDTRKQQSYLIS
jgi:hypothetical protein